MMADLEKALDISPSFDREPHRERITLDDNGCLAFSPNDQANPKNWGNSKKSYLTFVAILLVINATMASTAPTGTLEGIGAAFAISEEVTGLVTTLFLLGYVAGPLVWAPLSEYFGRRWIFFITFTLYLVFNFLCAFTTSFAGLLVGRFITGIFCSSSLSNAPGLISDLWGPVGRGRAMILFMVATFIGPAIGPIIAGFLQLTKDWRWTFYVILWLAGLTEGLLFTLPETFAPVLLVRKAHQLRKTHPEMGSIQAPAESTGQTLVKIFKVTLSRPWQILFDPISFLTTIYFAVVYTLLYMLFSIYPIVFQQKRHWNAGVGELPLIGVVVGGCLGGVVLFLFSSREIKIIQSERGLAPEDRLPAAMAGGILLVISVLWFSWTAEFDSIHWVVPTIAGVFLSTAMVLIFSSFINYVIDSYLQFAASAVAANTVIRSASASASPLYTQYMYNKLGVGGGGSLIGGIAVLLAPIPFVFYIYGPTIRKRSKFASNKPKS